MCALIFGGSIECWGEDELGQLGNGTIGGRSGSVTVQGITNANSVSVGGGSACAPLTTGHIECWGFDSHGQLGNGTETEAIDAPVAVSGITNATEVAAAIDVSCALLSSKFVDCWGSDEVGRLANSTLENSPTPVPIEEIE